MLKDIHAFHDIPDDLELDTIHSVSFTFGGHGMSTKQYIFVTQDDVDETQLAQNLRYFADMVEYGIEGDWH